MRVPQLLHRTSGEPVTVFKLERLEATTSLLFMLVRQIHFQYRFPSHLLSSLPVLQCLQATQLPLRLTSSKLNRNRKQPALQVRGQKEVFKKQPYYTCMEQQEHVRAHSVPAAEHPRLEADGTLRGVVDDHFLCRGGVEILKIPTSATGPASNRKRPLSVQFVECSWYPQLLRRLPRLFPLTRPHVELPSRQSTKKCNGSQAPVHLGRPMRICFSETFARMCRGVFICLLPTPIQKFRQRPSRSTAKPIRPSWTWQTSPQADTRGSG